MPVPHLGQGYAASNMALAPPKKKKLLGKFGDKPLPYGAPKIGAGGGGALPSVKLPTVRSLLAGGLK